MISLCHFELQKMMFPDLKVTYIKVTLKVTFTDEINSINSKQRTRNEMVKNYMREKMQLLLFFRKAVLYFKDYSRY